MQHINGIRALFGRSLLSISSYFVVLFIAAGVANGQQGTLTDNSTYPNQLSRLSVQGSGAINGAGTSYIKFNLASNLPAGTPGTSIGKTTLTLYVSSVTGAGSFNLHRVTSSWVESDQVEPTYDNANPIATGVSVTAANSYVTVDVTTLVQQWLGSDGLGAGGVANFGLALVAGTDTTAIVFDSKEGPSANHPPQLSMVLSHVTSADSATSFSGPLSGDVVGNQNATVVSSVGGRSAAEIATSAVAVNAATENNTPDTIVKRDSSGNFSAGTMTGSLNGNAATATTALNATSAQVAISVTRAAQDSDVVSPVDGQVYYDTTLNVFKIFDAASSSWKTADAGNINTLLSSAVINGDQISGTLNNASVPGTTITGDLGSNAVPLGSAYFRNSLALKDISGGGFAGFELDGANGIKSVTRGPPGLGRLDSTDALSALTSES
jgi:hypothetical protein